MTSLLKILKNQLQLEITDELERKKSELAAPSKTSKLCLGYLKMIDTARSMIKANRTGSWKGHFQAVADALPIYLQLLDTTTT